MGKLFDQDEIELEIEGQAPIELYRRRSGLLLLDPTVDLRCGVISGGERQLPGFSRPGVLVVASSGPEAVSCVVTPSDDLMESVASLNRVAGGSRGRATCLVGLARHRERTRTLGEMAAGLVTAELSRYERISLDEPPRNLGIVEAPRWATSIGELAVLALRAVGCDLGPAVRKPYPVEHPDLWDA